MTVNSIYMRRSRAILAITVASATLLACTARTTMPPIERYPYPIPENPTTNPNDAPTTEPVPFPMPPKPPGDSGRPGDFPPQPDEPPVTEVDPIPPRVNEPESTNPAVVALVKQSETLQSQGQYSQAGSQLERALRIESQNPWLMLRLAKIRLEQGQAKQAEAFARKSIQLAESSNFAPYTKRKLKYENWQLIADTRRQRGDRSGAREADSRTQDYVI